MRLGLIVPEFCGRFFDEQELDPFVLHSEADEVVRFVHDNVTRRAGAPEGAVIISLGRCGSTLLCLLLIGMGSDFKWRKCFSHRYIRAQPCRVRFVMYRDARDVICSLAIMRDGHSENIEAWEHSLMQSYANMFGGGYAGHRQKLFLRLLRQPGRVLVRYEDYLPHRLFALIEYVADCLLLTISEDYQRYLAWEFGLDRAARRAARQTSSRRKVDKLTRIHGRHINTGLSGIWKTHFTRRICELVKPGIGEFLIAYGYEESMDWTV